LEIQPESVDSGISGLTITLPTHYVEFTLNDNGKGLAFLCGIPFNGYSQASADALVNGSGDFLCKRTISGDLELRSLLGAGGQVTLAAASDWVRSRLTLAERLVISKDPLKGHPEDDLDPAETVLEMISRQELSEIFRGLGLNASPPNYSPSSTVSWILTRPSVVDDPFDFGEGHYYGYDPSDSILILAEVWSSPRTLDDLELWNRTDPMTTAFRDDGKTPHLKMHLNIRGGVTAEYIRRSILTFLASLETWLSWPGGAAPEFAAAAHGQVTRPLSSSSASPGTASTRGGRGSVRGRAVGGRRIIEDLTVRELAKIIDGLAFGRMRFCPASGPEGDRLAWEHQDGTCYFDILRQGTLIRFSFAVQTDRGANHLCLNDCNCNSNTPKSLVTPDMSPAMEMCLSLEGGVTVKKIAEFANDCRETSDRWFADIDPFHRDDSEYDTDDPEDDCFDPEELSRFFPDYDYD
jgi:hypothetical protein